MIFGYLVYYGLITVINNGLGGFFEKHGLVIYSLELLLGLVVLFFGIWSLVKKNVAKRRNEEADHQTEEEKIRAKIWSVTPLALIGIGVVSTASELTSALPYFAFLAVLINYTLSFPVLTLVLIFYNIIYMAPFMILYFIYIISKARFDAIYDFFKKKLRRFSEFLVPVLLLVVAAVVLFDSIVKIVGL